jgi:hypothetical protein
MRRGLLLILPFVLAACGGTAAHTGRTVTFETAGTFPPATITGTYSAAGCAKDARTVVADARQYYTHSTTAPSPADLYFYDMRFAYAHFEADGCASAQLGTALRHGLTARQRTFILDNVSSDLERPFRAALDAVG